jgi:hypothetical protein
MRDLRDPQKLGEWILDRCTVGDTACQYYDKGKVPLFPDVTHDDSMGKQCVREYRAELESRAAEGDRYAASALESIDAGKGVQGYDEAGS